MMRAITPALLLCATPALLAPPAALAQRMDRLDFMAGCWEGTLPDATIVEEIWTAPSENLMLGLTRYLDKGRKRATNWEFTFIERTDSTFLFIPQTRGEAPDTFRVRFVGDEAAAWTREGSDFPAEIWYRRTSDGSVIARLEAPPGSDQRSFELRFRPGKCPGK